MLNSPAKVLIIRLSSFGDILQCLSAPAAIKKQLPLSEIHWVVREDFSTLLQHHRSVDRVWSFPRRAGLLGWLNLAWQLRMQNYTHVFDAHANVRSHILCLIFRLTYWLKPYVFARRSKERLKRFLLFKLRINRFPNPFRGQISYLAPLARWGVEATIPQEAQLDFSPEVKSKVATLPLPDQFIALAPSAAWEMKRWPVGHWVQLIKQLPDRKFVILGGPEDRFCRDIAKTDLQRCLDLSGQLSLIESCAVLARAECVISADTGLLHAADLLAKKTIALIGPTAFGYPSHIKSEIVEVPNSELRCKPCSKDGRGKCSQTIYQKCMIEIKPQTLVTLLDNTRTK